MYILIKPNPSEDVIKDPDSRPVELDEFFNLIVYDKDDQTTSVSELSDLSSFLIKGLFPTFEWAGAISKCKSLFAFQDRLFIPFWVGTDW